ncbi:MAG: glycoside hydrolase family 3 N-terminal domain-containing protein [Nakamurella sp.]
MSLQPIGARSTGSDTDAELDTLADGVLMPCFDGVAAPEWLLRRVSGGLGAVCLFARNIGTPGRLRALTASLHARRADLVIAIDEEAGDVTRLDAATGSRFPGAAALGRADDAELTGQIGRQVGELLRDAGISLNFAPSADVAVDRSNPVIGTRSFGDDPDLVARHATAFLVGQQSAGVHACVKHFPGHGDTATDSHLSVAVVASDRDDLERIAVPPFAAAIAAGVAAVMTGHLVVPAIDQLPASLSARWTTEILRNELGFDGVVVTDALEMAAISGSYGIAGGAVLALRAGADLLCLGGEDAGEVMLDVARDAIVAAVRGGDLALGRLREAAARVRTLAVAAAGPAGIDRTDPAAATKVATRALQTFGPLPVAGEFVLVLRCDAAGSLAVGDVPWGLAAAGGRVCERALRRGDPLPTSEIDAAGAVVLLTRDRHRHDWMSGVVTDVRTLRPDAVLVEMGSAPVEAAEAPAIASHGASRANAAAVLAALGIAVVGPQS